MSNPASNLPHGQPQDKEQPDFTLIVPPDSTTPASEILDIVQEWQAKHPVCRIAMMDVSGGIIDAWEAEYPSLANLDYYSRLNAPALVASVTASLGVIFNQVEAVKQPDQQPSGHSIKASAPEPQLTPAPAPAPSYHQQGKRTGYMVITCTAHLESFMLDETGQAPLDDAMMLHFAAVRDTGREQDIECQPTAAVVWSFSPDRQPRSE